VRLDGVSAFYYCQCRILHFLDIAHFSRRIEDRFFWAAEQEEKFSSVGIQLDYSPAGGLGAN